jgi:hypothetical protein
VRVGRRRFGGVRAPRITSDSLSRQSATFRD